MIFSEFKKIERNRFNSTMNKAPGSYGAGQREESSMRGRREESNQYGGGYGGGSRQNSKEGKDVRNLKSEIQQLQQGGDDRVEIEVLERKLTQLQVQRDNVRNVFVGEI